MSLEKRLKTVQRPELDEVRSKSGLKKFFAWLVFLIICFGGGIAFFRMPSLQVREIEVRGTRALDETSIKEYAQRHLVGMWFWLIPRSNVLLISKSLWQEDLLLTFPSIKDLSISFENRTKAVLSIVEREPDTLWCDGNAYEQCYFVDMDGVVFEPAATFSRGVYTIMRGGPLVGNPDPLRKAVFEKETRDSIDLVIHELERNDLIVDTLRFRDDGDIEFSFESWNGVLVGTNSYILVTQNVPPARIVQMLSLVSQDTVFKESFDTNPGKLEYLDFRFPNKIMYKFQEGSEVTKDRLYEQL